VLSARWKLLHQPIAAEPENAVTLVKALCVLHNLVMDQEPTFYIPPEYVDADDESNGEWQVDGNEMPQIAYQGQRNATFNAVEMRENFCHYFNSVNGQVPWRNDHLTRLS